MDSIESQTKSYNPRLFFPTHLKVWLLLITLTLISVLFAEQSQLNTLAVVFICVVVWCKGVMVIDHLMGLRRAKPLIRWMMLSYFFILPPLIALTVLFPEWAARITTLS